MGNFYTNHKKELQNFFILGGGIFACFLFFRYLFPIFLPFVFGWVLSCLFLPLTNGLEKHGVPRWAGALLGILLLLTALGFLGYFAGAQLYEQLQNLIRDFPYYLKTMEDGLTSFWAKIDTLLVGLPDGVTDLTANLQKEFFSILFSFAQGSGSAYFLTKDREAMRKVFRTHVAPLFGSSLEATKKDLSNSLWGYLKTQLILMGYIFLICIIGLYALRSPYALLLSVAIAIIDALPFFGSGFVLWPGALLHFISGNTALGIGYLAIYAIVQVVRQLMQPKILGAQIGMHPLLTLFSMYFGYKCIGFWGLILGPVVAVILRTILNLWQKNVVK